jgi:hypothetical protein
MYKNIVILTLSLLIVFSFQNLAGAFKLPGTGQTICYNESRTVASCAGSGQDGASFERL